MSMGLKIFKSYWTCGSDDTYTAENYPTACVNQETQEACNKLSYKCIWTLGKGCIGEELSGVACGEQIQHNQDTLGQDECPCVGITDLPGNVTAFVNLTADKPITAEYPASIGSTCKAWDDGVHPACTGSGEKPVWCASRWCFVDACTCRLSVPPKTVMYFPGGTIMDRPIYYSYATCDVSFASKSNASADTYTYSGARNKTACVTQATEADCSKLGDKCTWMPVAKRFGYYGCVGTELATLCSPSAPKSSAPRMPNVFPVALLFMLAMPLHSSFTE